MHIVFLILLVLMVFFTISIVTFSLHTGISPMPTLNHVKKAILPLIPPNANVVDLGSGWGGVLAAIASAHPDATLTGIELSHLPWAFSRLILPKRVRLIRGNFFSYPLVNADVIFCYLYPGAMVKIKEKLERELKPSALIISHYFAIPGWPPEQVITLNDLWRTQIFLYRKKEDALNH